ncbi:tripartite tricarboxylate transporter substrate binding protein [Bradyrhizobium sp. ARR65]|uniref:Bug family tripartite tricarboxylate transporter substrate binding protein n=1 Tax=Bradyrhizobium sp. ARR65 TaxID=1040989 RepID=UPI000464779B|nr:tripartite tricarboxylate transporter substrate binding protein [Bradyrhizobium sp. ARR65]
MRFLAIMLAVVAATLAAPAAAEQWPIRNVRIIVPYPRGGNVDGAARILAGKLQERLGQPFIVENKPGSEGLAAGEAFAKSVNDGYTLFVSANGPVLFAPAINKRDAYQWKRDFAPITTISMTPLVLEVHPSVQARTAKEFFALVRERQGKVTMASPGAGTTNHLLGELAQSTLGVKWTTVQYRGNAPATNDLVAGHVQFAFDHISVALPYIKSGALRALAVTSAHRLSTLPNVPTFAELGYATFDAQSFTGLFAPAGTPAAVVETLHEVTAAILKDPAVVEKFTKLGAEAVIMTPAEFRTYLEGQDAKWLPVVRDADIKAD